jgi:hypothetical protein
MYFQSLCFSVNLSCSTLVADLLRFQIRDLLTELSCLLLMGELCGPPGGNAVAAHLTVYGTVLR